MDLRLKIQTLASTGLIADDPKLLILQSQKSVVREWTLIGLDALPMHRRCPGTEGQLQRLRTGKTLIDRIPTNRQPLPRNLIGDRRRSPGAFFSIQSVPIAGDDESSPVVLLTVSVPKLLILRCAI